MREGTEAVEGGRRGVERGRKEKEGEFFDILAILSTGCWRFHCHRRQVGLVLNFNQKKKKKKKKKKRGEGKCFNH